MRVHNRKWNIWGRRITSLLLLCGLLLPMMSQTSAASVTYKYNWIKSTTGLPTDNQWHDYFIAWEDTDDSNKYWFTDYHWYTADGYNNYDAGGSHWMEYKAASTLPDHTSDSFSSKECLGHLQIKFVGWTGAENNAPKYLIRMATMDGRYKYLTKYEPTDKEEDADAFTFLEKGDEFHIFVSIPGKADRYLTRDGQYLETTESTSYGGGEYWRPLRVYQRTFTIDETAQGDIGDPIGKVTLYEYSWVNTVEELMALASNKEWANIMLAWEDADGSGTSNPDKVWYTKEIWYEEDKLNYSNANTEYYYYSNDTLGSDGYSSPYAESFILPTRVSHFQMKFTGWDSHNPISGYTDAEGKSQDSPMFQIRFDVGRGKYIYFGNDHFEEDSGDALDYTTQLRLGKAHDEDISGSFYIFRSMGGAAFDWLVDDEYLTRKNNRLDVSNDNGSKYWEYPFRIYTYRPVEYDAVVKSFTIGKGATYSIDKQLIVDKGVTITVEDGGVLMVDRGLLNNGKIVVKNGGTVIVNEGGYIMAYDQNAGGTISLDGGNLIILDGAKVICDQGKGSVDAKNGATILNRGMLMVGNKLILNNNSCLTNEADAMLLVGGRIDRERGGVGAFAFDEIVSRLDTEMFTYLISNTSKIVNKGAINEPPEWYTDYSDGAKDRIYERKNGHTDIR